VTIKPEAEAHWEEQRESLHRKDNRVRINFRLWGAPWNIGSFNGSGLAWRKTRNDSSGDFNAS